MKSTSNAFSFKSVLTTWPKGEPRTTAELAALGMTPYRASALARSGWLEHLARGVYKLHGEALNRDASLALLSRHIDGLHVGGKTALAWRGVRHNVAMREFLTLWGDQPARLPEWFTRPFPSSYRATPLFDETMAPRHGLQPLPTGPRDVLVSVPERAFLELLSDVGKGQSLDEAQKLAEGLAGLRAKVLDELLTHTQRVKVVRLAHVLGEASKHPWAHVARAHAERLGNAGWVAVTKSGERIDLRSP